MRRQGQGAVPRRRGGPPLRQRGAARAVAPPACGGAPARFPLCKPKRLCYSLAYPTRGRSAVAQW
jgi:hypothetical protein